jgi:predicted  nucleic acid-binding Zn-ribbon protein
MHSDLSTLLKIQDIDLRTADIERTIALLPKRIAEIEKQLDSHRKRLELDRTALAANQKERRRLEDEIKAQDQKISKLRDQILTAKTNEQYKAFQHEIEFCQGEIRKHEDRILELMSASEALDQNVKKAEVALAAETKQVEAEKKSARETTLANQQLVAAMKQERAEAAATARKDYYANYERIRKRGAIAVAEAAEGRCNACHMIIRPAVMQQLRQDAEELIFCESCKRILFYNPPVIVEQSV